MYFAQTFLTKQKEKTRRDVKKNEDQAKNPNSQKKENRNEMMTYVRCRIICLYFTKE